MADENFDPTKYGLGAPISPSVPPTSPEPGVTTAFDPAKYGLAAPISTGGASREWDTSETAAPKPKPIAYATDDGTVLGRLKTAADQADEAVTGPGTWVDAVRQAYTRKAPPDEGFWTGFKKDVGRFAGSSMLMPNNAITPEEEREHPHLVSAQKGLGDVVEKWLTPASIGQIISLEGVGKALPTLAQKATSFVPGLAQYGPQAANAAKAVLTAVGGVFSADQIKDAIQKEPRIISAFASGDKDEAIRMTTEALSDLTMGLYGTRQTLRSTGEILNEATSNKTLKDHPAFSNLVHDLQGNNQIATGQKDLIKKLADRHMTPEEQQWLTRYIEAGGNTTKEGEAAARKRIREQRDQAKTGPKPAEQVIGNQGADRPISETDEMKPGNLVNVNAQGPDQKREFTATDDDGGKITSAGYNSAEDGTAQVTDHPAVKDTRVRQELYRNMIADAKEKGNKRFISNPESATPDMRDAWQELKKQGYPVQEIKHPDGADGFQIDLSKLSPSGRPVEPPTAKDLLSRAAEGDHVYGAEYTDEGLRKTFSIPDSVELSGLVDRGIILKNSEGRYEVNENHPGDPAVNPEHAATVVDSQTKRIADAIQEAKTAKRPPITDEQRARWVSQLNPDQKLTEGMKKYLAFRDKFMQKTREGLQNHGLMNPNQARGNYVTHDFGYDDDPNSSLARLFDTYHDAQMAGVHAPNTTIGDLDSDYAERSWKRIANERAVRAFESGRTKEGSPLAVHGGFVEGQHVVADQPQSHVLSEADVLRMKNSGELPDLIRSGRVVANADKSFSWKASDYQPTGLYKQVPIGNTPIPKSTADALRESGALDALEQKGVIFKNKDGQYFHTEPLYARTQLFGHPEVAPYYRDVVGKLDPNSGWSPQLMNAYDYLGKNMKSLLVAWSPFHRVTEDIRILNALGLTKGGAHIAKGIKGVFDQPQDIDYTNLTDAQRDAIKYGIVVSNPRGFSQSNTRFGGDTSEGLGVGEDTWGAKTYAGFTKALMKMGVPAQWAAKVNPEKILTENVFGPQGTITRMKFAAFDNLRPIVREGMRKANPNWSDDELNVLSGRETAKMVNNKFGGFNNVLAGRTLARQRLLRRLFFAPDFLETSMRSVLDLGSKYGSPLMTRMLQFQLANAFTAGAINYAIHRKPDDNSIQSAINASHIADHPGSVVSADGKTLWNLRSAESDAMRMINNPKQFMWNRFAPLVKDGYELATQRNEFGRKETPGESAKTFAKSALPLPAQPFVPGLASNTVAEPNKVDMFLRSFGLQSYPNRSDAESLALQKFSDRMVGQPVLQGDRLVHQQLKLRAEDKLRDALNAQKDPNVKIKNPGAVNTAKSEIAHLAARRLIDPKEQKDILAAADHSRLWGIFTRLPIEDALDVWDKTSDHEKRELGTELAVKYKNWVHDHPPARRTKDDMTTFDRFRRAHNDLSEAETEGMRGNVTGVDKPFDPSKYGLGEPFNPEKYGLKMPGADTEALIGDAASKYDVSPDLVSAVVKQESGGKPGAVSPKGAQGLMQLMPATAKQYGVTDIMDPAQNIDAGTHYLSDLLKQYNGDARKALAAYNAGPEAVEKHGGVPAFEETQNYVNSIMKAVEKKEPKP